jgi:hypothetical protein
MDLELPNANFNLYKYMKINIVFINEVSSVTNDEISQSRLSGEWIIIDIGYMWSRGKLNQTLKVVKKELGKTPQEIKNTPVDAISEVNTENNKNPEPDNKSELPSAIVPNSVYKVGEVYIVGNVAGKRFTITVTEILSNGNDIKGTIKNI